MARFDPRRPDALPHAGTFNNNVLSMAAGLAGLRDVFTPDAVQRLHDQGDAVRRQLDEVGRHAGVELQCTGVGSLMNLHPTTRRIRNVGDLADVDERLRDLLFYDLLEHGVYVARRGFIALSLPLTEADHAAFAAAFEDFLEVHRPALAAAG